MLSLARRMLLNGKSVLRFVVTNLAICVGVKSWENAQISYFEAFAQPNVTESVKLSETAHFVCFLV